MCASALGDLRGELEELLRERVAVVEGEEKSLERFRLTVMVKWDKQWDFGVFRSICVGFNHMVEGESTWG